MFSNSIFFLDAPSPELIDKVKTLYQTKLADVRILIPIVNYLSKKEVISALPKFMKLNPQLMKDVFIRLLGLKTDSKSLIAPSSEFGNAILQYIQFLICYVVLQLHQRSFLLLCMQSTLLKLS